MTPAPRHRPRHLAAVVDHPWWTALAAVMLALIVLFALWDWNWFKGPVEGGGGERTSPHLSSAKTDSG
ncbi:hypothetical protein, partial [Luteimonas salinilitoris]